MTDDLLVVTEEDFPHGLRCAECNRELPPGERYSEKLDGFIGDTPTVILVCVTCATHGELA